MDGSLDFNFPMQTQHQQQQQQLQSNNQVSMMGTETGLQLGNPASQMPYSTSTTTPSWVH